MSFIYEYLPSGFQGPHNLLRSIPHPPERAYVRFVNATDVRVDVMWVDFNGRMKHYRTLGRNDYFDCDTFVDHIWVFKDTRTHDPMYVNHKEVFWPKTCRVHPTGHPMRQVVRIHRPVLPLLTLAARAVRNKMKNIVDPFFLEIPFPLQCLIVRLILEFWHSLPERQSSFLFPVKENLPDSIFKKDFDEFQCNIMFVGYRLSMHAKKLMEASKKLAGRGQSALIVRQMLKNIITFLGFELTYDFPEQYSRKLAPTIWKQMIFLRIHSDNLKLGVVHPVNDTFLPGYNASYSNLRNLPMRRLSLMIEEQKNSVHHYHWEQLNLLIGNLGGADSEKIKGDSEAYDIPELIPLSERQEWEWVTVRREQIMLYQNQEVLLLFLGLTSHLIRVTDKLENIFQVLCFCHYQLLGHHITEEEITDELDSKDSREACSSSQSGIKEVHS